ncbi:bifunctional folylpolyglutamate synthase/dihydrofolate synthase [Paramaledivibacter caminithermalis]|uniref:Dihydrofolate synthase/folylpolyglutamate synthase n=1 Tax=Paramaledivibacter caminithermalis (strain DSM 15212 / CIP 107654 / DViRD3) TaxID=1121301 RepID=A0A1M6LD51_PARC5|nr:folylpolyglutamate synthase/dihydrofolate synthase family protein [Paramaledivibacter caminithermalis]SHJ69068.1 dihydrofolate synthase / folylpolyglutamate synthase [Paramaledivibacter caminithermalis DSM 15212]
MNYSEALEYIHGTYKFGSKLGLENIRYLLKLLGNPQKKLKVIHVAGTNGKGSTSTFISQILIEQGYKVGLFTSPYLEEFTERIRINGQNIPKDDLAEVTEKVKTKVEVMLKEGKNHPTEFEIVTAIAMLYYSLKEVDYVVLEVGLGGRLDSTNVIEKPLVSVITPISFDHIQYLGDTLDKIAYEKAGIIKEHSITVVHPQEEEAMEVIENVCNERKTKLLVAPIESIEINKYDEFGIEFNIDLPDIRLRNLEIQLLGMHQANNAAVALMVIYALREYHKINISENSIRNGLKNAKWPGRLEVIRRCPTLLIDGAHNIHGAKALKKSIKEIFNYGRLIGVIGVLGDKDVDGILKEIIPLCHEVIITRPNNPRAISLAELKEKIEALGNIPVEYEDIASAVDESLRIAKEDDLILYCGSLYMIGNVRKKLTKNI